MIELLQLGDAVLELNWGAIIGGLSGLLTALGAALKVLWSYWTKREEEKRLAWKKIVDDKDDLIKTKDDSYENLRKEKDLAIEALSKTLSKKSDEHAEKIQELMQLTLTKVEEQGEKTEEILSRALNVTSEITGELRSLTAQFRRAGGDSGSDLGTT